MTDTITGKVGELVERLNDEWQRLGGIGIDQGSVEASIASILAMEAADTISTLLARLEALEAELADAKRIGLKQHGQASRWLNAAMGWQGRAEAAEARVEALEGALTSVCRDLDQSIKTHEFNSRHMIAEDILQDAWAMLDAAREQFQVDANTLRGILSAARATLPTKAEEGR